MQRRGFTLIEMMIVVSVIVALFAISIPVMGLMRERARVTSTDGLVETVATAITSYQLSLWPVYNPTSKAIRNYRAWDWNAAGAAGRNDLDGYPEADDSGITSTGHADHLLYAGGYRGFLETVRPDLPKQFRGNEGRVIDAWGNTLRIEWAARAYGSAGFGIWSKGGDMKDKLDTGGVAADDEDNLTSWSNDR
ncbi:MAG: prepilin-type N-terminal cleavage/methylation domain-containing protein [Planctomycetota bacterium]|nr:prepilin-type N-terminal cleavage/methylation domain-containing protein [Planctomycetota bacterium]